MEKKSTVRTKRPEMANLYAFGLRLDRRVPIASLYQDVYLIHHNKDKSYKSFEEEYILPTPPSIKRGIFKHFGQWDKECPIFELTEIK